jgi:hypothetical protein
MRRATISVLVLATCTDELAGCADEPATTTETIPIIGGVADSGDPGVVAILSTGGFLHCTGLMISSRVVLTASHCLVDWRGNDLAVGFGGDTTALTPIVPVIDARRHPDFQIYPMLVRDVGLALLASPESVPASAIWRTPLDASIIGHAIRIVGFGETTAGDASNTLKNQGMTVLGSYDDDFISYTAMPSTTCHGDSGGPTFATDTTGTELVMAVTSFGDSGCTQASATRLDVVATTFIDPYLAQTAPAGAGPGDRCYYDGNCATGTCDPATDDARLSFCSTPCARTTDCIPGMKCVGQACRWPTPSPGTTGTGCQADEQCASDVCGATATATTPRCGDFCVPDPTAGEPCASGFTCETDLRFNGRHVCIASPSAGCGCRSAGSSEGSLAAAAAIALTVRRRRRARGQRL